MFKKGYKIKRQNLKIFDGVTSMYGYAFSGKNLINVEIPSSITHISRGAFSNNNLTNIKIPDSVTSIDVFAFYNNSLTNVEIPSSVTDIGEKAFDDIDIIYDGVLINKDLVKEYGCENIIKLYQIQKVFPLEKIKGISKQIIEVIPATEDALKGFILNRKYINRINLLICDEEEYKDIFEEEYKDIFKMCFVLGLFNKPDDDTLTFVTKVVSENKLNYIHQMWTAVKLDSFKPKFKELFIKLYNEGKTEYNGQNIIGRLYSSFEKISKYTLKRHEDAIGKKNAEIKRLKDLGANTMYLEEELAKLKKNKKIIEYEDIVHYLKNNTFEIREGNEALRDVVPELSMHLEQDEFDKIQDMYEESIDVEKNIPLTRDKSDCEIRYHWSKSDNPVNTILGYLVDCCAKLGGASEDIMRQSMINPDVVNLIIYDENNQVIGKATAYYNRNKKYILFNNAETKEIGTKGLKSEKQRQKECLEALIRGAMDAVCALKERGEDISEVRIGMLRNDLEDAIKEYDLEINHDNILSAYNWRGYSGDASDVDAGQAILYKDDEFEKNKNF